jgi:hypothetical protein
MPAFQVFAPTSPSQPSVTTCSRPTSHRIALHRILVVPSAHSIPIRPQPLSSSCSDFLEPSTPALAPGAELLVGQHRTNKHSAAKQVNPSIHRTNIPESNPSLGKTRITAARLELRSIHFSESPSTASIQSLADKPSFLLRATPSPSSIHSANRGLSPSTDNAVCFPLDILRPRRIGHC